MTVHYSSEVLQEMQVTYTLELNDSLVVIENVPARVNVETGEQFFAPDTVEKLQAIAFDSERTPAHFLRVPVYRFSDNVA